MNSLKALLFTAFLIAIAITLTSASANHDSKIEAKESKKQIERSHYFNTKKHQYQHDHATPWDKPRGGMTCDKFPRVCHLKGSPGHDCCKKKCVDVKTDRLNCGMCGLKCKYPEICCNGRCVNTLYDRHHCGGCQNKCNRGNFCNYGMCNYA